MRTEHSSGGAARPLRPKTAPSQAPARADAHAERTRSARAGLAAAGLSLALLSASCGVEGAESGPSRGDAAESAETLVTRLIELSTPLDPTLTSDHHDRRFHELRAFLAEMREADEEVGRLALQTFRKVELNPEDVPVAVRRHLLDVAAHAATEETAPLLESLTMEYGHKIDIRTEAALLLGKVVPERAVELLEPELKKKRRTSTMPDDEFLVQAYAEGCERSGANPVEVLASVATNLYKQGAARYRAVQELGKHDDEHARLALRAILVESTGDAYLRRKAAQSILAVFPREEACAIFELVSQNEADENFLLFLADMIQDNCE